MRHVALRALVLVALIAAGTFPGTPARATGSSGIGDSCMVGTWVDQPYVDTITWNGIQIALDGGAGATETITDAGTDITDYSDAAPLVGAYGGAQLKATLRGSVTNQLSADPTTHLLTIQSLTNDLVVRYQYKKTLYNGFLTLPDQPYSVSYSCGETRLSINGGAETAVRSAPDQEVVAASDPPPN